MLQPSLFDERDLAEIRCEEKFPGERLVVCRNPPLAQERSQKREKLLQATEAVLEKVRLATLRDKRPLKGETAIAVQVSYSRNRDHLKVCPGQIRGVIDTKGGYRDRPVGDRMLENFSDCCICMVMSHVFAFIIKTILGLVSILC